MNNAEAERFANLFPGYVSLRWRDYKTSVPRLEVVVDWKKALEDGQRQRLDVTQKQRGPQPKATSLPDC
jgi:hypothetical protein